jgi:hypothetical protein
MARTRNDSVPVPLDAVMNSLRIQGIAFGGPFCSPGGRTVLVVESCILLESELVDLLAQDKLNRDGIQGLAERIGAANSRQLQ